MDRTDADVAIAEYVTLVLRAIGLARPGIRVDRTLTSAGDRLSRP